MAPFCAATTQSLMSVAVSWGSSGAVVGSLVIVVAPAPGGAPLRTLGVNVRPARWSRQRDTGAGAESAADGEAVVSGHQCGAAATRCAGTPASAQ
ncbi:hypothetical protein DFJ68_3342 [Terracoccus luteus]|uniref:Uncharacterized protein n=1 Tax=Terracoccus luteus TaxID=53356 RepID=A0A495Y365_9MICO|nr:hypothetical protein DFJ68_3342 [Terracoccus luteus]